MNFRKGLKMDDLIRRRSILNIIKRWQDKLKEQYGENDEYVRCLDSVIEHIESVKSAECRKEVSPLKIKLDPGAFLPVRAHETDAGLDLRTPEAFTISPHESAIIDTGVHIQLPHGTYGKLESKSGLNVKHNIVSCGGTIDEPYTGSIKVKLYNLGETPYRFYSGDKIIQLIVQPCIYESVEQVDELEETDRGNNGFGSSGR